MRGARLSVVASVVPAEAFTRMAHRAEQYGLSAVWAHHPYGTPSVGGEDTASLMAISAAASVTSDIRLGAFLAPHDRLARLRVAEDLGVIDQLSGGRLEIALCQLAADKKPLQEEEGWIELLRAWSSWPGASGAGLAVTPAPAQPWLPRLFLDDQSLAQRLGGGVLLTSPAPPGPGFLHRRVLLERGSDLTRPKAAGDVLAELTALRARLQEADADEAMVEIDPFTPHDGIRWLGTVVQPGIRFDDTELPGLTERAVAWFEKGTSRW